ncbi:muts domain V-domain-containing protein [Fimicolochytrium jonesii]|uniref:muts domain V-domain-containing protein n=1 Tax=Fimicolochytrium jonesii TaxID=1396493 RepID=UPI0022FE19E4|nr:muts domain V-domain-containing protein [Fimicolochytrium jonesii]KAI8819391.1 muts domain V-domain-containing protein [Fimicolochytrium jonesii]
MEYSLPSCGSSPKQSSIETRRTVAGEVVSSSAQQGRGGRSCSVFCIFVGLNSLRHRNHDCPAMANSPSTTAMEGSMEGLTRGFGAGDSQKQNGGNITDGDCLPDLRFLPDVGGTSSSFSDSNFMLGGQETLLQEDALAAPDSFLEFWPIERDVEEDTAAGVAEQPIGEASQVGNGFEDAMEQHAQPAEFSVVESTMTNESQHTQEGSDALVSHRFLSKAASHEVVRVRSMSTDTHASMIPSSKRGSISAAAANEQEDCMMTDIQQPFPGAKKLTVSHSASEIVNIFSDRCSIAGSVPNKRELAAAQESSNPRQVPETAITRGGFDDNESIDTSVTGLSATSRLRRSEDAAQLKRLKAEPGTSHHFAPRGVTLAERERSVESHDDATSVAASSVTWSQMSRASQSPGREHTPLRRALMRPASPESSIGSPLPKRRRVPEVDLVPPFLGSVPSDETSRPMSHLKEERHVRFQQEGSTNGTHSDDHPEGLAFEKNVLALSYRRGKIGAAYYNVADSVLFLMEDANDDQHFEIVQLLKFQVQPSTIIVSARADDDFVAAVTAADERLGSIEIAVRPSTDFIYQTAKNKILSLHVDEFDGPDLDQPGQANPSISGNKLSMMFQLESIISLENQEMVCCAGALLNYISKAKLTGAILERNIDMEVAKVEQFNLKKYMQINADAMWSLQIFQDEAHPNMFSKRSKEGLSLFGILDNTKTPLGRTLLKQWFLRPSMEVEVIRQRHAAVEFFLMTDIRYEVDQLRAALRNIKNIPRALRKMKSKATIPEWQMILKFAYYSLKVRGILREITTEAQLTLLQKMNEVCNVQELKSVGSLINNVVDFDASVNEARFVVKPHVDDELDEMKRTYHGLDDLLSQVAHELGDIIPPEFATSMNVIYFPQLGYLITIPLKEGMTNQEDFVIEGLHFQFCTSNTVYYKSDRMFELDETIGDIHSIIVDREIEIMQKLQETVLTYRSTLVKTAEVCAELDCILSLAEAAAKYHYSRPEMKEENVLQIRNGRHPLQELCVDVFVPNNTQLGFDDNSARIVLLTGANSSGKSIYLKQVALIAFMAQIGSFVPAERATIGLTDKILTRVQTRESVSKLQSTFMIDVNQVGVALACATARSLVLLDEFGKGTDITDGVGLLCGVIEQFAARAHECPNVIVATHFHEINTHNLLNVSPQLLQDCTMEILETQGSNGLTFLYRISPGRATSSWGVHCAALAGMQEDVLRRGREASEKLAKGDPMVPTLTTADLKRKEISHVIAKVFMNFDVENDPLDNLWVHVDGAIAEFDESRGQSVSASVSY